VRYFLTGATGFLGGAIARELRAAGHEVRALVRDPARATPLAAMGVSLHRGDVSDRASMRAPMHGVDGVYHAAGWYKIGVRDRSAAVATNIDGTRNVLELMRDLAIPRGVYTSTLAVNSDTHGELVDESYRFTGRHVSIYDWTKAEAHAIAGQFIAAGLPLVIVQPGLIYGPGDTSGVRTMLVQYLERRLPMIPKAAAYCWAHIDDEARGHVLAMEHGTPGRNYFLAGPPHTIAGAFDLAERITGIPAPRVRLPSAVLKGASGLMRLVAPFVNLPPSASPESLRVLAGVTYLGRADRARDELGWRARPLADGLAETLRHEMRLLGREPGF
jgi:nucleoside-diphosphate-sugar epimerase